MTENLAILRFRFWILDWRAPICLTSGGLRAIVLFMRLQLSWIGIALLLLCAGCNSDNDSNPTPEPAAKARHPFMLFGPGDVAGLRQRAAADPLLAECYANLQATAQAKPEDDWWTDRLEASAFIAVTENDSAKKQAAIELMLASLRNEDAEKFYKKADFHNQARPLRALALGWDWLEPSMTSEQKAEALPLLEHWSVFAQEFTEKQWWREASYNVGAIPVSGYGLLALSIRNDSNNPAVETVYREAVRRIGQNYFPTTWKPSGICYEGPNYAIVGLKYASEFAHAVERAGGDDLTAGSGAPHAIQYLMHQYMPAGGCAPVGDNTGYGPRTFAAEYLLGISKTNDAEGLFTWRKYAAAKRLDPLITYLWYPLNLTPVDPRETKLATSHYFEVTPNRAGYVFGRSAWEDKDAAFFAFTTRFERCNHQHYDMDSFLFGGFGTLFATHKMLFPYPSDQHGVDFEHNIIIIDGGGWPKTNRTSSCGDDNSTDGLLVGLTLSKFADYIRGDAKWSYRDNSIMTSDPAVRAERSCLFVKQGPTPYLLILDDNQQINKDVKYEWLWYAPALPMHGTATLDDPLVIKAENGSCAIAFVTPEKPALKSEKADLEDEKRKIKESGLTRIRVEQNGMRVRYAALASLQKDEATRPKVSVQKAECRNPSASAVAVSLSDGAQDFIAWQSEEERVQCGIPLTVGALETDGLLAMVHVEGKNVTGFVLGEGTYLKWNGSWLVKAGSSVSVSAGAGDKQIGGRLRSRQGLPEELAKKVEVNEP